MYQLLEKLHGVKGLDPVADAFDGTVYSDIISLRENTNILFIIHKGVGASGTSTITVEASDDASGSNVSAVPFRYKSITSTDIQGAINTATTSGFTLTAGSSQMYMIEAIVEELLASGYEYIRLKAVEVVNSPVLADIVALAFGHKNGPSATLSIVD